MSRSPRILAPAVAALALAAAPAHARPAVEAPNNNSPAPVVAPVAGPSSPDGFDWGSAAIGAGGIAGLVALFAAGAATVGRVRVPSPR